MQQKLTGGAVAMIAGVLLIAACGGDQSIASKSAAAYRDAQEKGVAVRGGHDHGDHGSATDAADHSTMTGMDHSRMSSGGAGSTDHSAMQHGSGGSSMKGMDHSRMSSGGAGSTDHSAMQHGSGGSPMSGMDHSRLSSGRTGSMDHSAMQHGSGGSSMQGIDHSAMPGMQHGASAPASHATHSMQSSSGTTHGGMQHGTTQGGGTASSADHSAMQHSTSHSMPGMTHGTAAMQHGAAHPVPSPSTAVTHGGTHPVQSRASAQQTAHGAHAATGAAPPPRIDGAAMTLEPDAFDAPAPIAVREAAKAAQNIAEPDIRRIVPGTDSENPPTPAPPIRSGSGAAPAVGGDHSQHGAAPTPQPAAAPSPAVDHSQHGAKPAPAPRVTPRSTPPKPAAQTIYTCPMHPEVTSPKPGTCPKCGMALVKKSG